MKTEKVKVGAKFGTEHFQVECNLRVPEAPSEFMTLAVGKRTLGRMTPSEVKEAEDFVTQMFVRGWRIWNQEQSGARDFIAESTVDQRRQADFAAKVQGIIDGADPLTPAQRSGRPRKPAEVTITPEQMKAAAKDPAKFAELLAAQGIKVNLTQGEK